MNTNSTVKNKSKKILEERFNYLKDIANHYIMGTNEDKDKSSPQNDRIEEEENKESHEYKLSNQYGKIDISNESALLYYLYPEGYKGKTNLNINPLIFPFGCNESQFHAVENAITDRISVIEGPPGTGKTQTILNIIANLVIREKTVQVVSNNNSAIENVLEKLCSPEYKLDYFVARLGRSEYVQSFIDKQSGVYSEAQAVNLNNEELVNLNENIKQKTDLLRDVYCKKRRLAELIQEESTVELEHKHLICLEGAKSPITFKKSVSSSNILDFWQEYEDFIKNDTKPGIIYKVTRYLSLGIKTTALFKRDPNSVISRLSWTFYEVRKKEIKKEILDIEETLETTNAEEIEKECAQACLRYLKGFLSKKYDFSKERTIFNQPWAQYEDFLKEYPVVLGTTYSSRSCLGKNGHFDYLIMDEASQIDVATGALALSSADNAVIVGDSKQLSNIISNEAEEEYKPLIKKHKIDESYNMITHSLLMSVIETFGDKIPKVMLVEHYRCHPKIIGFCNKQFYRDNLVIMTRDNGENALSLLLAPTGNHARDNVNRRHIDIICESVLPNINCEGKEIGIIAPYKKQVAALRKAIKDDAIEIDTVHKFQGREKDVIILSIVDDTIKPFSDKSDLLNVAISRAKKQLIIVSTDNEQPAGTNIAALIDYIRYSNCEIHKSTIVSVFDYLYQQNTAKRWVYLEHKGIISEYDSENLMNALIHEVIKDRKEDTLDVMFEYPLNVLFNDISNLSEEQKNYIKTGLSHVDFLIYNKVTKRPLLGIEVDGYAFHKDGTVQKTRDAMKNDIFERKGIKLVRFATTDSGEAEKLNKILDDILGHKSS